MHDCLSYSSSESSQWAPSCGYFQLYNPKQWCTPLLRSLEVSLFCYESDCFVVIGHRVFSNKRETLVISVILWTSFVAVGDALKPLIGWFGAGDKLLEQATKLWTENAVDDEVDATVEGDEKFAGRLQVEDYVTASIGEHVPGKRTCYLQLSEGWSSVPLCRYCINKINLSVAINYIFLLSLLCNSVISSSTNFR